MPHIHEKIDFTVEVFIVYGDKILLRKHDKYGHWLGVGGHVELNEDPIETAHREVNEEVGLDIDLVSTTAPQLENGERELIAPRFMNRHRPGNNPHHEHVTLIYFARSKTDAVVPEKPTDEWRWVTKEELRDPHMGIMKNIIFYAETALTELGKN